MTIEPPEGAVRTTCPRRMEDFGPWERGENLDYWDDDGTCSFCGSCSPELFFEAVRTGAEVGATDKNYKAYIDLPESEPDALRVVSAVTFDDQKFSREGSKWVSTDDPSVRLLLEKDGWRVGAGYKWVLIAPRGPVRHAKFYFQHLSEEQRHEFITLYNDKTMKISEGGFYRKPFFVTAKSAL